MLRGLKILNSTDQSVIAERSSVNPDEWVTIPPLSFDSLSFPIVNKIVTNELKYEGTFWSGGSNYHAGNW